MSEVTVKEVVPHLDGRILQKSLRTLYVISGVWKAVFYGLSVLLAFSLKHHFSEESNPDEAVSTATFLCFEASSFLLCIVGGAAISRFNYSRVSVVATAATLVGCSWLAIQGAQASLFALVPLCLGFAFFKPMISGLLLEQGKIDDETAGRIGLVKTVTENFGGLIGIVAVALIVAFSGVSDKDLPQSYQKMIYWTASTAVLCSALVLYVGRANSSIRFPNRKPSSKSTHPGWHAMRQLVIATLFSSAFWFCYALSASDILHDVRQLSGSTVLGYGFRALNPVFIFLTPFLLGVLAKQFPNRPIFDVFSEAKGSRELVLSRISLSLWMAGAAALVGLLLRILFADSFSTENPESIGFRYLWAVHI
ncbi:MAG: hypothetical protein WBD31_23295, partial [Rubripirellula sp.]